MSETVTIELPEELLRRARKMAVAGNRRLEEAVIDWISQVVSAPDGIHRPIRSQFSALGAEFLTPVDSRIEIQVEPVSRRETRLEVPT